MNLSKIFSQQVDFEGAKDLERFESFFYQLYRIEIFKDGLDLILTKLASKELRFEIKQIKDWDTNVGCFLTENNSFIDKALGKIWQKKSLKIIIRKLSYNVLAHEMAHALEYESKINLGEEFRKCIGLDMKNREPDLLTLKAQKNRLMIEALKSYPQHQFLSELFARYFELLSFSRDVCQNGDFTSSQVMDFFENTTNFITQIFNPTIKTKIDGRISKITAGIAQEVLTKNSQQKFQHKIESNTKKNQGMWSNSIKSNASWSNNIKNINDLTIEDKKG